jgi:hypothetical protein
MRVKILRTDLLELVLFVKEEGVDGMTLVCLTIHNQSPFLKFLFEKRASLRDSYYYYIFTIDAIKFRYGVFNFVIDEYPSLTENILYLQGSLIQENKKEVYRSFFTLSSALDYFDRVVFFLESLERCIIHFSSQRAETLSVPIKLIDVAS